MESRDELSEPSISAKMINSQTRNRHVIPLRAVASMLALSFVAGCATGQQHAATSPFSGPGAVPLKMQQGIPPTNSAPRAGPENLWPSPVHPMVNNALPSQQVQAAPLEPEAPPAPLVNQKRVITAPPPVYGSIHGADMTPKPEVRFIAPRTSAAPDNSSAGSGQPEAPPANTQ